MGTKLFNAEDARKLAKEVKDTKDVNKEVENYISNVLHHIELAIKEDKNHLICNVGHFRKHIIDGIIKRFEELGFTVTYGLEDYSTGAMFTMSFQYIIISGWVEKDEKMIYVKTDKDEDHEKVVSDLIKSLKKDKQYFEHKPVYWRQGEFPKQFFL